VSVMIIRCRPVVVLLPVVAVLISMAGCGQKTQAIPPQGPPPAAHVVAAKTEAQDIPLYLEGIGKCVAPEIVSIQPQVAGRITGIHFTDGTEVKKGDKLFSIDPRPFQVHLDQAKAEHAMNLASLEQSKVALLQLQAGITRAEAMLSETRTRQKLNVMEFERAKGLLETNAVARQEYDTRQMAVASGEAQIVSGEAGIAQAKAELKQGEAAVNVSQAKLAGSQATIAAAELNLEYTTIFAPISGRIGQKHVDIGNIVKENDNAMPLVVLQTLDPIYAEFTVPESEFERVQAGLAAKTISVECWAPGQESKKRNGDVFFLDSSVQGQTGTLRLRAKLKNEDRAFWPGQFVNYRLVLSTLTGATLAPSVAIQIGQTGPYVFVVKADSTVELRPVKPGLRYGTQVAVLEGLKAGETVVTEGHLMLQPGAKVDTNPPAMPPAPVPASAKTEEKTAGETAK